MKSDICEIIESSKIIAIIRRLDNQHLLKTAQALYDGGIRLIEVPFLPERYPNTYEANQIKLLNDYFSGKIKVGAGTILNKDQVERAYEAGAQYIISPNTDKNVIEKTKKLGMVSIPGALTPTEIQDAYSYGADYIKVFPSTSFSPHYIKEIHSSMTHVKLIAVGGVNEDNAAQYIESGASAVGIGSGIIKMDSIKTGNYEVIKNIALKCLNSFII